jgi:hypothetical protein
MNLENLLKNLKNQFDNKIFDQLNFLVLTGFCSFKLDC